MTARGSIVLGAVFSIVLTVALPFAGGGGPSIAAPLAAEGTIERPAAASAPAAPEYRGQVVAPVLSVSPASAPDTEHVAQKPVPPPPPPPAASTSKGGTSTAARRAALAAQGLSCPGGVGGATATAPGRSSGAGVPGTTTGDIQTFANAYNAIRVANCLPPVPAGNFRYDSCMEDRLFWMAEDPDPNPSHNWGHTAALAPYTDANGVVQGVRGCDGNLAGGTGNSGATVAQKWWDSAPHRASLYRPGTAVTGGTCIYFAMTHGGIDDNLTRAAARWAGC